MRRLCAALATTLIALCCQAREPGTIYVDNIAGKDSFDGLSKTPSQDGKSGPFATIAKAFATVGTSGRIEVANTGRPHTGGNTLLRAGGTPERPLVVEGNGATISGLDQVPAAKWTETKPGIYETDFWPMSNMLKGDKTYNHWIGSPQIWWVDSKEAANCKSVEELEKTENAFYWDKWKKKAFFHIASGKKIADVKVEMPVHGTSIDVQTDYVVVQNFRSMLSWNDGFDTHGRAKGIVFKNCVSTGNCGQGFSSHDHCSATYEDCLAEGCASSGSCDVNYCMVSYRNCVFSQNTFEAGVYALEATQHIYENCLIVANGPFEQIWALQNASMTFLNCVIIGKKGNPNPALKIENGTVTFNQCTFIDVPFLADIQAKNFGKLKIMNSIIAKTEKPFLKIPAGVGADLRQVPQQQCFVSEFHDHSPQTLLKGGTALFNRGSDAQFFLRTTELSRLLKKSSNSFSALSSEMLSMLMTMKNLSSR